MAEGLALRIEGMMCDSCSRHIERALAKVPGAHGVKVSYTESTARVTAPSNLDPRALIAAVEASGYGATVEKTAEASRAGMRMVNGALGAPRER